MTPAATKIEAFCKRLHLANTPRIYRELATKAEQEQWSYRDFLAVLLAEEVAHRQQTRLRRDVDAAGFPFLKTIEEFDFTFQSTLRLSMMGSYLSPDFVPEGRCLILLGKTGRGKTHLAIAIAYRAIQNGFRAFFVTAAALIDDLSDASRHGRLREALVTYVHPDVLVVDEVGYLTYGTDAANVLFPVVYQRHLKKKPMLFTTNKALRDWGQVLHDPDLAATLVDRVLERGRLIQLDGPSMRTRHLELDEALADQAPYEPARISGIDVPQFPEPPRASSSTGRGWCGTPTSTTRARAGSPGPSAATAGSGSARRSGRSRGGPWCDSRDPGSGGAAGSSTPVPGVCGHHLPCDDRRIGAVPGAVAPRSVRLGLPNPTARSSALWRLQKALDMPLIRAAPEVTSRCRERAFRQERAFVPSTLRRCSVAPVLKHRLPFRRAVAAWHTGRAPVMLWPPGARL